MAEAKKPDPRGDWYVVRQDFHGTQYLEKDGVDQATAEAHLARRRPQVEGHKQDIWITQTRPKNAQFMPV